MAQPHMTEDQLTALLTADGEMVTERLSHWARTTPEKTFFYYGEDEVEISYAAFEAMTDAMAGNFARLGVVKGDRISVFTRNSMMASLAMFAIWKAGAVYAPINFSYTGRLLAYQINDTKPVLVISDQAMLPNLDAIFPELTTSPKLALYHGPKGAHDHVEAPAAPEAAWTLVPWGDLTRPAARPQVELTFDDAANLIYTSGTTGPAKGVLQPHRWINNYTFGLRVMLTPEDVIYNDLPLYHVGGAHENVCRAAWMGCEVAVWNRFSPDTFWQRIAKRGATTAILLDVMIPWLMQGEARAADRENTLNKVHMQPLALQHNAFATRFGIDFVTAGFGQTESGLAFWTYVEETEEGAGTPPALYRGYSHAQMHEIGARYGVSILKGAEVTRKGMMGWPAPFTEVSVRDALDRECPDEVVGELALRPKLPGIFLKEYFGKPEATVKAFRNLWFHTGDAVLRAADGSYFFVDRLGDRIRVRGENLSSFQVEDMIVQHPEAQLCAAISVPSAEGDEDDIVAFVVPVEGTCPTEAALHAFAAQTMPKFMRPKVIRIVETLPRTPTNKVEKYKLRQSFLAETGR